MANLQCLPVVTIVNLEFGWVKYWQMTIVSPNSPKFSLAKVLRYTVVLELELVIVSYTVFINKVADMSFTTAEFVR